MKALSFTHTSMCLITLIVLHKLTSRDDMPWKEKETSCSDAWNYSIAGKKTWKRGKTMSAGEGF